MDAIDGILDDTERRLFRIVKWGFTVGPSPIAGGGAAWPSAATGTRSQISRPGKGMVAKVMGPHHACSATPPRLTASFTSRTTRATPSGELDATGISALFDHFACYIRSAWRHQ